MDHTYTNFQEEQFDASGECYKIMNDSNKYVSDCQTRWTRLRQRYSKEQMLCEQETRSGAEKSTRPRWFLFDSLNFLGKHMIHRKSITNMSFSQQLTSMVHQANKETYKEDFREEK